MGYYEEFQNLCFVDTLDNVAGLKMVRPDKALQIAMFGLTSENSERIKKQNEKKISVVIGNPPYNANQANENDNNKNREYPIIDKHIKETFIKESTAQKTKVYDMYARFYRWAMDRLDNNGIIAFITNRSFIDSRTFDGFRKCIGQDFSNCYIIDTRSDVRANPKIAGTMHNVFGIQTGVAVMFLVKKENKDSRCRIEYIDMPDDWRKEEKLNWFKSNQLETIPFVRIEPDKKSNWINLADSDFESLIPIVSKDVKAGKSNHAIFELYTSTIKTNRDEWVFDFDKKILQNKIVFFLKAFNEQVLSKKFKADELNYTIKWSSTLKEHLKKGKTLTLDINKIIEVPSRPFITSNFYSEKVLNDRLTDNHYRIKGSFLSNDNIMINIAGESGLKPFQVLATKQIPDYSLLEATQCLPLYRYDADGNRIDNISYFILNLFREHYQTETENHTANASFTGKKLISKEDIFHYVYAVLHNLAYRKKYELDLKREFPRLPLYDAFFTYVFLGKQLMDLHINYETAEPFPLKLIETKAKIKEAKQKAIFNLEEPQPLLTKLPKLKVKLKADKETGIIELDEQTALTGVPKEAWDYKLGNRSALEWVLDQYKEKKPADPTIAEKFNTYRFADYKEQVIDLLKRVCTVSVETVRLIGELEKLKD